MQSVKNIEEIVEHSPDFVDLYTSTDADEFAHLVLGDNYRYSIESPEEESAFLKKYDLPLVQKISIKDPLVSFEGVVLPIPESLLLKSALGFIPMSQLRIYTENKLVFNLLLQSLNYLKKEKQHLAYVNQNHTQTYIYLFQD